MDGDRARRGFSISATTFDEYAADYDAALARGLSVSGEGKHYFARGRVEHLARCLRELGVSPARALDFGCGVGTSLPLLGELLGARELVGVDVSPRSLAVAARSFAGDTQRRTLLALLDEYAPCAEIDLAFCNGVFHHVPPAERGEAVSYVRRALAPGGLFSFWENNPWSPGARYVMHRIPFDRDAVMVSARAAATLLREGGFAIERVDFAFFFPRVLAALRPLERRLGGVPLGAQYQILARKRG